MYSSLLESDKTTWFHLWNSCRVPAIVRSFQLDNKCKLNIYIRSNDFTINFKYNNDNCANNFQKIHAFQINPWKYTTFLKFSGNRKKKYIYIHHVISLRKSSFSYQPIGRDLFRCTEFRWTFPLESKTANLGTSSPSQRIQRLYQRLKHKIVE